MRRSIQMVLALMLALSLLLAAAPVNAEEEPLVFGPFSVVNLNGEDGKEAEEPITETYFADAELTMINFWATWCPPCVEELPELAKIEEATEGRVRVIGVLLDGTNELLVRSDAAIEAMYALAKEAELKYPVVLLDDYMQQWSSEMEYVPTTVFVNAKGEVVDVVVGGNTLDGWLEVLTPMLEESKG